MADSLFDLELPDDGDRVSLIGAPAEEPSCLACTFCAFGVSCAVGGAYASAHY